MGNDKEIIKVLIFSHSSGLGGAERSLITLVRDLIQTYNTEITVVLPDVGPSVEILQKSGAEVLFAPIHLWCTTGEIPNPNVIINNRNQFFDWLIEHREDLLALNPDVVITNTIVIPWGSVAAALLKRPHIWMINEFGELDHGFKFFLPFKQILKIIEKSSDLIVTRSNAIKDTLFPHLKGDQVKTIYRSIDLPEVVTGTQNTPPEHFQIAAACSLALIGTIRESKGQEDAVRAVIELIKHRNRQVELVMVGQAEEPYRDYLVRLAEENGIEKYIHFLPFQENVRSIIDQADIILVCSRMEAVGRVTLESMLLEKPIIATNTGGTSEMIDEGETGLLYEPGNIHQLADQIEKLMDNPEFRQKFAKNGAEFARTTFTKENYAGEFYTLFQHLTQQHEHTENAMILSLIDHLVDVNTQLNAQNVMLKAQSQILEQEVLSYATSKSWRFTRPIRKLFQRIKKS